MRCARLELGSYFSILTIVFVFLFSSRFTFAQHFHESGGLICSECHTMHYSQDGTTPSKADAGGPFDELLLKENTTDLCLTCHDGQVGKPDVVSGDVNGLTERAAGQFKPPGIINNNGHNLSHSAYKGSGVCNLCHAVHGSGQAFTEIEIGCINCHDPHGNGNYRNLHWLSDPASTPEIRAFVNPAASGMSVYEKDNIGYAAPSAGGTWREVTNICVDCHRHGFSGYDYTRRGGAADAVCIRHPSADSAKNTSEPINKNHQPGTTDPTHWTSGSGEHFSIGRLPFLVRDATNYASATTVAETNEVFCLTCHKAHGSQYPDSLRWNYSGNGDNRGCQQCHNK